MKVDKRKRDSLPRESKRHKPKKFNRIFGGRPASGVGGFAPFCRT